MARNLAQMTSLLNYVEIFLKHHDEENVLHVNSTISITYWKAFSDFPRRSRANLERYKVTEVRGK